MIKRIGCMVFIFLLVHSIQAQIDTYETWAEIKLDYSIAKDQALDLNMENRSNATSLTGSRQYFTLGYKNKTLKRITLLSDLRFAIKPSSISELRLGLGAQYSYPFSKKLAFDLRSIWQSESQRDASEAAVSYAYTLEWRNKIELDYAWNKKNKTSLGSELFYDVSKSRLDRWRSTLSQKTRLAKNHWISAGLGFQKKNIFSVKKEESQLLYLIAYSVSI